MNDQTGPEFSRALRARARAVLDAILTGDRRPVAIAHPLEFVCVPVLRTPGFGVCGHIWQAGRSDRTIHCHSWRLASEVVLGAVLNEIFAVTDRVDGDHHLLGIDSVGLLDRMAPTGRAVSVASTRRTLHPAGDSYGLRAGVFHRSTPAATGLTLTLLAATTVPGASDQIVAAPARRLQDARRKELPASAARAHAALLRSAIDDS